MGYCYTKSGLLCCDICGRSGGVRKRKCPFGYCQPIAACPSCKKERAKIFTKEHHRERGCEKRSLELKAKLKKEAELLESGQAVRCSAMGVREGSEYKVHVLFRKKDKTCIGFYMSKETYDALPLSKPFTPDDYRQHGELIPAPPEFNYGVTSKMVV